MSGLYTIAQMVLIWLRSLFEGSDGLMDCIASHANSSKYDLTSKIEAYAWHLLKSGERERGEYTQNVGDRSNCRHEIDSNSHNFYAATDY